MLHRVPGWLEFSDMGMMDEIRTRIRSIDSAAHFNGAELLMSFWETSAESVEKLLPGPLKPGPGPVAMAVFANYHHTNFGPGYLESSLYLGAEYDGARGMYCLSMPITSESAANGHSRLIEYPRKLANAAFMSSPGAAAGSGESFGLPYCGIQARLNDDFNSEDAHEIIGEYIDFDDPLKMLHFNYSGEEFRADTPFDSERFIYRREMSIRPVNITKGYADIRLTPSVYEPWFRVGLTRALGALYVRGDYIIGRRQRIAKARSMEFGPYAFSNWDLWMGLR